MKQSVYYALALLCFAVALTPALTIAGEGKAIFNRLKCTRCHHPDQKINGPALKTISGIYADKKQLMEFFRGEASPIVEPERFKTMKIRLRKIKKLQEADQQALAGYIMSFKE